MFSNISPPPRFGLCLMHTAHAHTSCTKRAVFVLEPTKNRDSCIGRAVSVLEHTKTSDSCTGRGLSVLEHTKTGDSCTGRAAVKYPKYCKSLFYFV